MATRQRANTLRKDVVTTLVGGRYMPSRSKKGRCRSCFEWVEIVFADVLATISGELRGFPERVKILHGNQVRWACERGGCNKNYAQGHILHFHHRNPLSEVHWQIRESILGRILAEFLLNIIANCIANRRGNAVYLCLGHHIKEHMHLEQHGIAIGSVGLLQTEFRKTGGKRKAYRF